MTLSRKQPEGSLFLFLFVFLICMVMPFFPAAAVAGNLPGTITTIAGGGAGDGYQAVDVNMANPNFAVVDSTGNIFIADKNNNRIRKVDALTGVITTVAGNGVPGYSGDNGLATSAQLNGPQGVFVDSAGNIYIADATNRRIRKVSSSTGVITTIAGNGSYGYSGDDGSAILASLEDFSALCVDSSGNVFIVDFYRIRKVDAETGVITTVAGNGSHGYSGDGGAARSAGLNYPTGIFVDASGNMYICDRLNQRIRKVDASSGVITTVAGNGSAGYSGDDGSCHFGSIELSGRCIRGLLPGISS